MNKEVIVETPLKDSSDIIREGGLKRRLVRIIYVDKKDEMSYRVTEPYEIKDGKYYGFCHEKGSIRAFKLENIRSAVLLTDKFIPRWNVKF